MPSEWQGSRWPGSTGVCPSMLASALQCPGPAGIRTSSLWREQQVENHALPELPTGVRMDDLRDLRIPAAHRNARSSLSYCCASSPREDAENGIILKEPACLSTHACVQTPPGLSGALVRQGSTQGPGTFPCFLKLRPGISSLNKNFLTYFLFLFFFKLIFVMKQSGIFFMIKVTVHKDDRHHKPLDS